MPCAWPSGGCSPRDRIPSRESQGAPDAHPPPLPRRVRSHSAERVSTVPPAPVADTYLSDLEWASAANGWGPVERDRSNGRQAAVDGTPISFGGVTYAKGLGVHAPSEIVYHLGGTADRFTALVGIDDFSTNPPPARRRPRCRATGRCCSPAAS
ncbi:NPCBM/NEW2 domain-containing protein [Streptomyces katrae]|uniref:NPCBM/NEW2 domain-containing protein n=1 Tax=Streptomyces katrae TaxID=68223 RepID=UPI001F42AA98|nr:NPCBM/NEW2 domain-containing protein [Streptomyces katrae]